MAAIERGTMKELREWIWIGEPGFVSLLTPAAIDSELKRTRGIRLFNKNIAL